MCRSTWPLVRLPTRSGTCTSSAPAGPRWAVLCSSAPELACARASPCPQPADVHNCCQQHSAAVHPTLHPASTLQLARDKAIQTSLGSHATQSAHGRAGCMLSCAARDPLQLIPWHAWPGMCACCWQRAVNGQPDAANADPAAECMLRPCFAPSRPAACAARLQGAASAAAGPLPDHVQSQGVPPVPAQAVLAHALHVLLRSVVLPGWSHLHTHIHHHPPGEQLPAMDLPCTEKHIMCCMLGHQTFRSY